ncbi:uncharacterized protein LOC142625269 [Castanea sativa]|uniref:uncharacterized protein LOC142625269 n=1 Tax=Castanea sativa TaxID=21020 RepID=UPI003F64BFCC
MEIVILCGKWETSGHVLWGCNLVGSVWGNTKIKLPIFEPSPREFIDIVWEIKAKKPEIDWELFAVTAWSLWNNRNSVRHGGRSKTAKVIVREVAAYADEVRIGSEGQVSSTPHFNSLWSPPRRGLYKINVGGTMFKDLNCCGVGVVIRNERGQLMGALSKRFDLPLQALEAEGRQWNRVQSPSSIQKIIEGTTLGLRCFDSWEINYVSRKCNSAAHLMARYAKNVNDYVIWVEDTRPVIVDQVLIDVHLNLSPI